MQDLHESSSARGGQKLRGRIPVIDIFAGPGGLGEGFSSFTYKDSKPRFRISLSIEKDPYAFETLKLRTFFRLLVQSSDVTDYYRYLRKEIDRETLYDRHKTERKMSEEICWNIELGRGDPPVPELRKRIRRALGSTGKWVLIGGPPCQAYSLIGRSRMKRALPEKYENDSRHFLYKEYLKIVAEAAPPVFVMENVKGLISTEIRGINIFELILKDLSAPALATGINLGGQSQLRYNIFSLSSTKLPGSLNPKDYLVKSERYGVPQVRHRVFLLGVRADIEPIDHRQLLLKDFGRSIPTERILAGLPRIRSGLSGNNPDDFEKWKNAILELMQQSWFRNLDETDPLRVKGTEYLRTISTSNMKMGDEFTPGNPRSLEFTEWFWDGSMEGVCNHSARRHLDSDLHRYFFSALFAATNHRSPTLDDFPEELLPAHRNVIHNGGRIIFKDRFRVQLENRPSSTVTSHISKDGHYYIHYDPLQCRSLTVREAARLQTFPDNYFFEGPRTAQYVQVGNAVPPLLARQIAESVYRILESRKNII